MSQPAQDTGFDKEYDFVVLGTGLKECVLCGLLSKNKYKVLQMDRNTYYGGEAASLNLVDLYKKYRGTDKVPEEKKLGKNRDYCVDQCPKLIMACGNLVKILLSTKVTRYLEFKPIDGSFVYKATKTGGAVHKVPASGRDAWNSKLLGMMEKYRFKTFLDFVVQWKPEDTKTWPNKMDCRKTLMKDVYAYYKLSENIQEFIGHAVCLYLDEGYKNKPAADCLERAKLYAWSVARYGKSPYIYPKWGLGGLPEGFSRLCAVNGGVYMLNKPFKGFEYKDGKCIGVHTLDENGKPALAKAKLGVLTGPTYCQSEDGKAGKEIKQTGQVARWICFMDHPIEGTANAPSAQIIIPGAQVKHKTDMYISFVSYTHQIASKGMYVAVISAKVEATTEEDAKKELMPARKLLGKTREEFFSLNKTYVTAVKDESKLFITDSYDATTHWETSCREIISTYKRMTGKEVDLSIDAAKIDDDPE